MHSTNRVHLIWASLAKVKRIALTSDAGTSINGCLSSVFGAQLDELEHITFAGKNAALSTVQTEVCVNVNTAINIANVFTSGGREFMALVFCKN